MAAPAPWVDDSHGYTDTQPTQTVRLTCRSAATHKRQRTLATCWRKSKTRLAPHRLPAHHIHEQMKLSQEDSGPGQTQWENDSRPAAQTARRPWFMCAGLLSHPCRWLRRGAAHQAICGVRRRSPLGQWLSAIGYYGKSSTVYRVQYHTCPSCRKRILKTSHPRQPETVGALLSNNMRTHGWRLKPPADARHMVAPSW